jgi:hypothetical protein
MRGFKPGAGDKDKFTAGNYVALRIIAKLIHTTVNVPFAGVVIDWTKIKAKLILQRNKVRYDIFNEQVLPLALASGFKSGVFDEVRGGGTPLLRRTIVAGGAVKEKLVISARIELPGVINLMKGDILSVELSSSGDCVTAVVDATVSTIEWELEEGIGNSLGIPYITTSMITGGQSTTEVQLGNGVKKAYFINNDKFTVLEADQIIDSVSVKSDKLNKEDDWYELVISRSDEMPTGVIADTRFQSFELFDVEKDSKLLVPGDATDYVLANDVSFKFQFLPANVSNAKNYVVAMGFIANSETAAAAFTRNAKHENDNAAQIVG